MPREGFGCASRRAAVPSLCHHHPRLRQPQDAGARCAATQEFLDPALERSYEQYVVEHTWPVYRWHIASILLTTALAAATEMLTEPQHQDAWLRLGVRSGPMLLLMLALYTFERSRSAHICFCAALQLRCCVMMLLGGWTTSDRMLFVASSAYSFVVLPCLSPLPFKWQVPAAAVQVGRPPLAAAERRVGMNGGAAGEARAAACRM